MVGLLDYLMSPYYGGGAFGPTGPQPYPQGGDPMAGMGAPAPFPQGGDPMDGTGSGNSGGLPKPAATPASIPAAWGALYPSSLNGEADQAQQAREAAASVLARRFRGASHAPAPEAAPAPFGAGAVPFGFAGPGSMNVDPSQIAPAPAASPFAAGAKPVPFAGGPVTAQPPAGPATDLSSVNRDRAPDDFIPVGDYQMPAFRGGAPAPAAAPEETAAAPSAAPARAPIASPAAAPFSLAGSGFGDRLMKGTRGFMGNMSAGPIGALMGGLGALVTGQDTDPTSIAAGHNNLTEQALLKAGADPATARAARYNPALQKALIEQYYGKDKWTVVQTGEDDSGRKTYMQQNQVDGTLRPIAGAPAAGSGAADTVMGPDGKPIAIPPGLTGSARKEFLNHIARTNADAATGKQTGEQAKSAKFSTIATQADSVIKQLEAQGQSVWGPLSDKLPLGGAYLQTPEYQKYKAAKEAFLGAHLRDVSGAAIGSNEYVRADKTFFPQPGEGPETVAQKAALRAQLLQEMGRSAGPGYKAPPAASASGKTSGGITWSVQ